MDGTKPWYTSKAVWGGVVAALAGVASLTGVSLGVEDQDALVEVILALVSAVGGAIAVYGRVTAAKTVGKPTNPA